MREEKAREYHRLSRRLLFLELGISAILLLALLFTGVSAKLANFLSFPLPWKAASYLLILALGYGVIMTPLAYFQDFVLPHRHGLSIQPLKNWLIDRAKSLVLRILLGLCLVSIVYWLMENLPGAWWLAMGFVVFVLSLLLTWLTPRFLIPLFFQLKPLEEGELKGRLLELARRAGQR